MTRKECKTIRLAIDESVPARETVGEVAEHLNGCAECRSFEAERRALQNLIADLGTVSAPADFDFRLRARLAREKSAVGNGGGLARFLKVPLPIGVAALVLLMAVGGILIKNWRGNSIQSPEISTRTPSGLDKGTAAASGSVAASREPALPSEPILAKPAQQTGTASQPRTNRNGNNIRPNSLVARKGGATATRDMGLSSAAEITSNQTESANPAVLVPLDGRVLRISIDDGRGTSRTVSLPTVSFGSQRLMSGNAFSQPVSSSKGVW
jgi:hypothetical protein